MTIDQFRQARRLRINLLHPFHAKRSAMSKTFWTAYVPGDLVPDYEKKGWKLCEMAEFKHHDAYSAIMEWGGPGVPPPHNSEDRLSVHYRFKTALADCEAAFGTNDQEAMDAALHGLGKVMWNLAPQIEAALREG